MMTSSSTGDVPCAHHQVPQDRETDSEATLSDGELKQLVRAHYHDDEAYAKEVAETMAAFRFLSSNEPTTLVSLACGSCVGAELFAHYFPHPKSSLHGVDIAKRQTVSFLLQQRRLTSFLAFDLFEADPIQPEVAELFRTCNAWIAIHACRTLANRCVQLFRRFAPQGAHLVVLPCCLLKTSTMKEAIGIERWKEIRARHQQRENERRAPMGNSDWRVHTAVQVRNELLAREFPEGFVREVEFAEVPSLHNRALVFVVRESFRMSGPVTLV